MNIFMLRSLLLLLGFASTLLQANVIPQNYRNSLALRDVEQLEGVPDTILLEHRAPAGSKPKPKPKPKPAPAPAPKPKPKPLPKPVPALSAKPKPKRGLQWS
ncbi:hypothetical protein BU26DRAFT_157064 [Trematosphaeria pertusa]|uniref:Uncharacterized protein n=1 Tax=Trematosphaeria pertusa TaxID=390896 RepID=A0A6A6HWS3_9PLEO|nr:uncharacterized protein BU26DRAFT_157064 [Trematosphaeria pertusa]KAF2242218.1 hypothetical protein BU26DRAFT_157064 [Trematosphaeria pertusa]